MSELYTGFVPASQTDAVRSGEVDPPEMVENILACIKPTQVTTDCCTTTDRCTDETQNTTTATQQQQAALDQRCEDLRRVYALIIGGEETFTPREISHKLNLNRSTTRSYLKILRDMGLVYSGEYSRYYPVGTTDRTHGYSMTKHIVPGIFAGTLPYPLLQNLNLSKIQHSSTLMDFELSLYDCNAALSYGIERDKWTLVIQTDNGVSIAVVQLVILWADTIINNSISDSPIKSSVVMSTPGGILQSGEGNNQEALTVSPDWSIESPPVDDWILALGEFLLDVPRWYEGVNSFTWRVAEGWLLKAYRKPYGTRFEGRVSQAGGAAPFLSTVAGLSANIRESDNLLTINKKLDILLRRQGSSP